jgi:hypothetical protein
MVSAAVEPWLELGACVGALALLLAGAGAILAPHRAPWVTVLWLGVSALILALTSYALLTRLDALSLNVRRCLGCGLSLAPYALGGWGAGLAALTLGCAGCAVGLQAVQRQRRWIPATLLLVGLLVPSLVVVSFVNGLAQPLIPSERYLSPLIIAQALLVIACGLYLRVVSAPN